MKRPSFSTGGDCRRIFLVALAVMPVRELFCARLDVLSYSPEAAAHSGQLRAELGKSGKPIGPYDQMIAGQPDHKG